MDRGSRVPDERRQRSIEAVATFTAMMHADEHGKLSEVEEAQRALDRLGIVVRFANTVSPTCSCVGMIDEHKKPLYLGAMARRLRVPATWLRAEAEAGRIPYLRAGSALLFDPEVVERIVFDRLRESSAQPKGVSRGK